MSRGDLVKSRRLENRAAAHARLSNEAASDMIGLEESIGALVVSNPLEENPLWRAEKVDNYLGLPGLSGAEMLATMRRHAEQAGVEFLAGKVLNAVQMPDAWYVSVGPPASIS